MALLMRITRAPHPQARKSWRLDRGRISIGREAQADWHIDDPDCYVSRRHCVISAEDGVYTVIDSSTGGTFLDGAETPLGAGRSAELRSGSRIAVGGFEITVTVVPDETAGVASDADPFAAQPGPQAPAADPFAAAPGGPGPTSPGGDPFAAPEGAPGPGGRAPDPFAEGGAPADPFSEGRARPSATPPGRRPAPFGTSAGARDEPEAASERGSGIAADDFFRRPARPPAGRPAEPPVDPAVAGRPRPFDPPVFGAEEPPAPPADRGKPPLFDDPFTLDPDDRTAARAEPPPRQEGRPASGGGPGRETGGPAGYGTASGPASGTGLGDPFGLEGTGPGPTADPFAPDPAAPPSGVAPPAAGSPGGRMPGDPFDGGASPPEDTPTPPGSTQVEAAGELPHASHPAPPPAGEETEAGAAAPAARPARPVADGSGLAAFLEGAGLAPDDFSQLGDAELRALGRRYRLMLEGIVQLLRARREEKSTAQIPATQFAARDVNPLKFSVTTEEAVAATLAHRGPGYLEPDEAIEGALDDIYRHEVGMWRGLEGALRRMLDRFDPQVLEAEMADTSTLERLAAGGRSAALWKLYEKRYAELARRAEERFLGDVGADFVEAYGSVNEGGGER